MKRECDGDEANHQLHFKRPDGCVERDLDYYREEYPDGQVAVEE